MYPNLSDPARSSADLAANLTDRALELLADAGMPGNSVETELKLWHALQAEIDMELRWRHLATGLRRTAPLGDVLRRLVHRVVRRVAGEEHAEPEYQPRLRERAGGQLCLA
jgi:hypothetical protein